MTKSGSLASVLYPVGLNSLMIHKDVSGSQDNTWFLILHKLYFTQLNAALSQHNG